MQKTAIGNGVTICTIEEGDNVQKFSTGKNYLNLVTDESGEITQFWGDLPKNVTTFVLYSFVDSQGDTASMLLTEE